MAFVTYTLISKLKPGDNCHGWSPTIPRRVTHQPKDGHPPEGSVLQTWNFALTLPAKLIPGDICYGLSPTILLRVTLCPKDGHPPEGGVLQSQNLAFTLYSQN